jgi:beta-lactam-binding protein with PASTA domain
VPWTKNNLRHRICSCLALVFYCFLAALVSRYAIARPRQVLGEQSASPQHQTQILRYPAALAALTPQTVKVPELIKRNVKDAENALRASKLVMGQPQAVPSRESPGTVVRQYPEAGSEVKVGATILIWVSEEPPKRPQIQSPISVSGRDSVSVPYLVGLSEADARAILSKNGLSLGGVTQIPSTERPGLVVEQEPGPKSQVSRGSSVSISLAAPKLVDVPSLVRHRKDDAIRILQLVGLSVNPPDIQETASEEETGIVLWQDPTAGTQVASGTSVRFGVSRQIERKLLLRAVPANIVPGDSVTLIAELNPPLPGAEFQFNFGEGDPGAWSSDAQAEFTYRHDGNYKATVGARWNNGNADSNTVRIVVHSVKYDVKFLPDMVKVRAGEVVTFRAEVRPPVQGATYIYHFGDSIPDQTSSLSSVRYAYRLVGDYSASVTVRIADAAGAAGALHSHDFPSTEVRLSVTQGSAGSVTAYVIGAAVLIVVVGYAVRKIKSRKVTETGLQILVHKDQGIQSLLGSGASEANGIEIAVVRSWGEQKITSQGPLWARIETIHE